MSDLANILSPDPGSDKGNRLSEEQLRAYLEGRLSDNEQHEVEQWLAEEGMESDAVDGLKNIGATETGKAVAQLNIQLRKQLATTKRKKRRPTNDIRWAIAAIGIVLLLALLGYVVIRMAAK